MKKRIRKGQKKKLAIYLWNVLCTFWVIEHIKQPYSVKKQKENIYPLANKIAQTNSIFLDNQFAVRQKQGRNITDWPSC